MSYSLLVEIDRAQIDFLKTNGFTLCISKAVSVPSSPNFIWASTDFFFANTFQWKNTYKIFGTLTLDEGTVKVHEETQHKAINFGQTCTIDATGAIGDATGSLKPASNEFMLKNEFTPMNVGVTSSLTVPGAAEARDLPFYISEEKVMTGSTVYLTPVGQITLWFRQADKTSTMIEHMVGAGYTLDFTGNNPHNQTVSYNKAGQWQLGPILAESRPKEAPEGSAAQ